MMATSRAGDKALRLRRTSATETATIQMYASISTIIDGPAVGAAVALALVGTIYIISSNSTAQSYSGLSATPQIDVFAIMVGAKDLPSEQFDAS